MVEIVGNKISFANAFYISELPRALTCLNLAVTAGHADITLDFSRCDAALPAPMLALCAQVSKLRLNAFEFTLVLPDQQTLTRHFRNANWAYLLDPYKNEESKFRGISVFPATEFHDFEGQQRAVDFVLHGVMSAVPNLDRKGLAALEWSVTEITDNVLNHSQSSVGGIVQMSMFKRRSERIEYIVADAGLGIPRTLRQAHPVLSSDAEALGEAIREGVTRDKGLGQGNGLYGSYNICSHGEGIFHLQSGGAKLVYTRGHGLQVSTERVPFEGTLVAAQINYSNPRLLSDALNFGGKVHILTDFIETRYEQDDSEEVLFVMKKESPSFRSRPAGAVLKTRLLNLAQMCHGKKIVIDFSDIPVISSSFADEVFGKIFVELGPICFAQKFEFRNITKIVRLLMDKAISQRLATGGWPTSRF